MIINKTLPTKFAKFIAAGVGLYDTDSCGGNNPTVTKMFEEKHDRLVYFQQMAIGCDLGPALNAYHGIRLSAEQNEALALIHTTTNDWLLGGVIGSLLDKLNDTDNGAKEIQAIATTILENLANAGAVDPETSKRLIIRLADTGVSE